MDLTYIPTAPIYFTVQEKTTPSSSKNNDSNGTECFRMGQKVMLDSLAPEAIARLNKRSIKNVSQLRGGDRIRAEGLMMVHCGIKINRRGKPQAFMSLIFNIREQWDFLGNLNEDGVNKDNDNSDSYGNSNMSDTSDGQSNNGDNSSSDNSSSDIGNSNTSKTSPSYSFGITERAKAGGKNIQQSHEDDKRAKKRPRDPEPSI
jgi:hypothetical protein